MAGTTDAFLKWQVALSCFAAQRLVGVLPLADREPLRSIQELFYQTGEAAKKEFRRNTWLFGSLQVSDRAGSALADLIGDSVRLKVLNPSYVIDAASDLFKGSTDALSALATTDGVERLTEQLQNMRDVLEFVNDVDAPEELATDGTYPLVEKLEKFYRRGDYPAVWLVEGLGERYAHAHLKANHDVKGLLSSGPGAALPEKSQLMMHAGMGIALAKDAIDELTPWSTETKVKDALNSFIQRVRQNSLPGCEGAALESLGLVTRTWYPQLVGSISDQLIAIEPDVAEYFWHGAGRAMYFSPMNMLPGLSPWECAENEPPDDTMRRNAHAGAAWAFTIVNIRQHEIAVHHLRHKSDRFANTDAFLNGVQSTLIMAGDVVPGHKEVAEFCRFRPEGSDSDVATAWDKHVGRDVGSTTDLYRHSLRAHNQLGEIFRYHDLADFTADLEL